MQTLILKVEDNVYDKILDLLSTQKGVIIEKPSQVKKIKKLFESEIKAFKNIDNLVEWQKNIRSEWE